MINKATASTSPPQNHSYTRSQALTLVERQSTNPAGSTTSTTSSELSSSATPDEVHISGPNLIWTTSRPANALKESRWNLEEGSKCEWLFAIVSNPDETGQYTVHPEGIQTTREWIESQNLPREFRKPSPGDRNPLPSTSPHADLPLEFVQHIKYRGKRLAPFFPPLLAPGADEMRLGCDHASTSCQSLGPCCG